MNNHKNETPTSFFFYTSISAFQQATRKHTEINTPRCFSLAQKSLKVVSIALYSCYSSMNYPLTVFIIHVAYLE